MARAVTENSGRERTTAFVYAVGWTQHTLGAQFIRTAAIIQLLLGNMGRPGGGIMAMRGHASIQGSTDIPTLYNILPGYLAMPVAGQHDTWQEYVNAIGSKEQKGFWANADAYAVSLLKAWWGDAATAENDWAFDYLPGSPVPTARTRRRWTCSTTRWRATSSSGRTPPWARPTAACSGWARAPEVARGPRPQHDRVGDLLAGQPRDRHGRAEDRGHRHGGLLPPPASHVEKAGTSPRRTGCCSGATRPCSRRASARASSSSSTSLGKRIRERLAGSTDERDRPLLDLTWDYPLDEDGEIDGEAVLREINGYHLAGEGAR